MESEPTRFDWLTLAVSAVGSLATVTALIVAIALGVHEVRKFRRDQVERQQEQTRREIDARRVQADRVAGWLQFQPAPYADEGQFYVSVDIVNASSGAIYEAKAHGHTVDGTPVIALVGMIPPGETGHTHLPPVDERPPGHDGGNADRMDT